MPAMCSTAYYAENYARPIGAPLLVGTCTCVISSVNDKNDGNGKRVNQILAECSSSCCVIFQYSVWNVLLEYVNELSLHALVKKTF